MAKTLHKMKKGNSKFFENYDELLKWLNNHKVRDGEFSLSCGQGKSKEGLRITKQTTSL